MACGLIFIFRVLRPFLGSGVTVTANSGFPIPHPLLDRPEEGRQKVLLTLPAWGRSLLGGRKALSRGVCFNSECWHLQSSSDFSDTPHTPTVLLQAPFFSLKNILIFFVPFFQLGPIFLFFWMTLLQVYNMKLYLFGFRVEGIFFRTPWRKWFMHFSL